MEKWEKYLEGDYDENGNLIEKYKQRKDDEQQAKEIEEQIEKMYDYYKKRADIKKYLIDGAVLRCNQATLEPFEMSDGTVIQLEFDEETETGSEEKKITQKERRYTELHVTSNDQTTDNGSLQATVFDCIQGENIEFRCNCKLVDDRKEEYQSIKDHPECAKKGVCQYLMKLNDRWENLPTNGKYETITVPDSENKTKEKIMECITMTSVLFCKHGGLITPVNSGQKRFNAQPESIYIASWLKGYKGEPTASGGIIVEYSAEERSKLKEIKPGIDWYSYEDQSGKNPNCAPYLIGQEFINAGKGVLVDEKGRYWLTLGPKVFIPDYPDAGKCEADEFGKYIGCRVDVVLQLMENEDEYVYIECLWSGNIKAHTYNNA